MIDVKYENGKRITLIYCNECKADLTNDKENTFDITAPFWVLCRKCWDKMHAAIAEYDRENGIDINSI